MIDVFNVSNPKAFVTPNKALLFEEISRSTQVFNSYFIDKMKNPGTYKTYKKTCPVVDKTIYLIAINSNTCVAESGLVTKKKELLWTFLYFYSHL